MKIAYVSPLSPIKSGISDYSEELLPFILEKFKVDVFTCKYTPINSEVKKNHSVFLIRKLEEKHKEYHCIIYHMGNNYEYHHEIFEAIKKFPGIVVMHDVSMQNYLLGKIINELGSIEQYTYYMEKVYGREAMVIAEKTLSGKISPPPWETSQLLKYPFNELMIKYARGILVHSSFAKNMMQKNYYCPPVRYTPFPATNIEAVSEVRIKELRNKYNIAQDDVIIASFGLMNKIKRIDSILYAIKEIKNLGYKQIKLLLVGRSEKAYNLKETINRLGLSKQVIINKDVSISEFKDYLRLSDICLNLRYPTAGETSAALFRILGFGKPVILTNIGSFAEIPKDCCIHVRYDEFEINDIILAIKELLDNPTKRKEMGKNGREFVKKYHHPRETVKAYTKLIEQLISGEVYNNNSYLYQNWSKSLSEKLTDIDLKADEDIIGSLAEAIAELI